MESDTSKNFHPASNMIWEAVMAKRIFNFHGAYKSKRAAVREEKKIDREHRGKKVAFIQKFGYFGGPRYAVVTRKGKGR